MSKYDFLSKLVLRTPSEAFSPVLSFEEVKDYLKNNPRFIEALYVASPSLYEQIQSPNVKTNSSYFSLAKYILRNRTRSTPFGLFAGVGVAQWGNSETDIIVKNSFKRSTRLDMTFLCSLGRTLESDFSIKKHLKFFPNTSIYELSDSIRYTESHYENGKRVYQMSSVESNLYLKRILEIALTGARISDLAAEIVNDEVNFEEAEAFIEELIDAQLLVSEIEPNLTGLDYLDKLILVSKNISKPIVSILIELKAQLMKLDEDQINPYSSYDSIKKIVNSLGVSFDESKLFQVDKISILENKQVNENIKSELFKTISRLSVFNKINSNLKSFKLRFLERYESREMPLFEVLDSEFGIGYLENETHSFSPLIEDLKMPKFENSEKEILYDDLERKLFRRLLKASLENEFEVSLESIDFEEVALETGPSISVVFRLINEEKIFLETVSGASGTNLLARFGSSNHEIEEMLTEIVEHENLCNPNVVFAEIVHLPENRTGNILFRPAFRKHEIPYLAQSSNQEIRLQDLYISIQNDRIVLRHNDSEIIPRLGTAHNFSQNSLPIYHFLCDLQSQNIQSNFGFSWGKLSDEFTFLPRVVDGNVIVSLATWQFSSIDLQVLLSDFKTFSLKQKIPRFFVWAEADNELFVDLENDFLVNVFLDSIKNKRKIVLKEFLLDKSTPIKNAEGNILANQFIATLLRKDEVYNFNTFFQKSTSLERKFLPGSEWLYFKIFCGAKTMDKVLLECIKPLIDFLREQKLVEKWFFIRYNEPSNHIRFRIKSNQKEDFSKIFEIFQRFLKPFFENKIVFKVEMDTYERELERYGFENIEISESYFCFESEQYLEFLSSIDGDEREDVKVIYAIKNIDNLLAAGSFSLESKLELLKRMKNDFATEFSMNQELKFQIDKKYRENRYKIESVLRNKNSKSNPDLVNLIKEVSGLNHANSIFYSYIHMLVNRVFADKQRVHELVIYDFLFRYYKSQKARNIIVE